MKAVCSTEGFEVRTFGLESSY